MRIQEVVEIDATTDITIGTHKSGAIDVILQDPQPAGCRVFISCADKATLRQLVEVGLGHLRQDDPPRKPSSTFDKSGTVIPDERGES